MGYNELYLIRHGETEWNTEKRRQGQSDSPLTPRGIALARAYGRHLRATIADLRLVTIETSPLGRAHHTATLIGEELGIDPDLLKIATLLMEHGMGQWEGLTNAEVDAQFPGAREQREANKWTFIMPGGESYAQIDRRARQWLATLRSTPITLVVTHEMMSCTLQGAYLGLSQDDTLSCAHPHGAIYHLDNCHLTTLLCEPDMPRL